jgi:hypothetical protein
MGPGDADIKWHGDHYPRRPRPLPRDTTHTVEFIWEENTTPVTSWTNNWTFTIARYTPADMPRRRSGSRSKTSITAAGRRWRRRARCRMRAGPITAAGDVERRLLRRSERRRMRESTIVYRGDRRPNHANITAHTGIENLGTARPAGFVATTNYRWVGRATSGAITPGQFRRDLPRLRRAVERQRGEHPAGAAGRVTAGVRRPIKRWNALGHSTATGPRRGVPASWFHLRSSASLDAPLGAFNHPAVR